MNDWYLKRYSFAQTETEGRLIVPGLGTYATIERPWIATSTPGGMPNESCVPDGAYNLERHTRPDGSRSYALVNHHLGVYHFEEEVPPSGGRFLILIHIGNWITDLSGCVAPGIRRYPMLNKKTGKLEQAVAGSGRAMREIMTAPWRPRTLHIITETGTGR